MKLTITLSDKNSKGEPITNSYSINTEKLKDSRPNLLNVQIEKMIKELEEKKWISLK